MYKRQYENHAMPVFYRDVMYREGAEGKDEAYLKLYDGHDWKWFCVRPVSYTHLKLFDFVAQSFPDKNTEDFINTYMKSKTRKSIDEAQAYVNTMNVVIVTQIAPQSVRVYLLLQLLPAIWISPL